MKKNNFKHIKNLALNYHMIIQSLVLKETKEKEQEQKQ